MEANGGKAIRPALTLLAAVTERETVTAQPPSAVDVTARRTGATLLDQGS